MAYFALPYRILFHDSMAYGSHHFLTNFKFQCEAREHLLFGEVPQHVPSGSVPFDRYVFLTQEGYARTLAPAFVGARVCILLSIEASSPSSVRFCFRVIGEDGAPVCCGYQTVVCLSRETKQIVPAPEAFREVEHALRERLAYPNFADRIVAGDLGGIFDEEACAIGKRFANAPVSEAWPRIVLRSEERNPEPRLDDGAVLLFAGQGSYDRTLLRALRTEHEHAVRELDALTRAMLDASLVELLDASDAGHARLVQQQWPLTQIAMYATGVLAAQRLLESGVKPAAFAGHSVGEVSALGAAGAFDLLTGAEIVCRRALALANAAKGGMMALTSAPERAAGLLKLLAPSSLHLAVVNDPKQSVVSGTDDDLSRLVPLAAAVGIAAQRVAAPYPFHSPLLNAARAAFARSLQPLPLRGLAHPVYSPMARGWYAEGQDLARTLPAHLVERLDFGDAVATLERLGAKSYIECGDGSFLRGILERGLARPREATVRSAAAVLAAAPKPQPAGTPAAVAPPASPMDVAIVSLGCVLPGASDVSAFWEMIRRGTHAIVDVAELSPDSRRDFLVAGGASDKTYSLLAGVIRPEQIVFPPGVTVPESWSFAQRLLGACLLQCRAGVARERRPMQLAVGSTADGMGDLDEALLQAELDRIAAALGPDVAAVMPFLGDLTERHPDRIADDAPGRAWQAVGRTLLGDGVETYAVDAACASSIYSIATALYALRSGRCDFAYAGGVFNPGPVNNCLFSQFRGLSATGSRPFDASADGVVFSSGAAMVALKRLPDALADGDRIHAIVRGIGLSSDGASASVTEPKVVGQTLAMERAHASSGVAPESLQYIEAHATATPVGDAVELGAIQDVVDAAPGDPVVVGSVKSLIGHAGWAAGAASVVKVCAALAADTLPAQSCFSQPGAALRPSTRVVIPTSERRWPRGRGPRRAGINAFGFGGANAHMVLEEFVPDTTHGEAPSPPLEGSVPLAVIGIGALYPWEPGASPGERMRIDDARLTMAGIRRVLPEVEETMDRAQRLAVCAGQLALGALDQAARKRLGDDVAVILGLEGKTHKSIVAIDRIHAHSVARRLRERWTAAGKPVAEAELEAATERILAELRRGQPSSPYSLQGLMPNVVAGRAANLLNLRGANYVVDAAADSFALALQLADDMLRQRACGIALVGGIGGAVDSAVSLFYRSGGRPVAEAAVVVALTTIELAEREGLPVRAHVWIGPAGKDERPATGPYLAGAEGSRELVDALEAVSRGERSRTVSAGARTIRIESPVPRAPFGDIRLTTPNRRMLPAMPSAAPAFPRSVLLLVDDARVAAALAGVSANVVVRSTETMQLTDDAAARAALQDVDPRAFDLVLAVKDLDRAPASAEGGLPLLDLLFVTTRHFYERIGSGETALAVLTTTAGSGDQAHPVTGLFGGFLKALARELPSARCRAVHTDDPLGDAAIRQFASELARETPPVEVFYRCGRPEQYVLEELPHAAPSERPPVPDGAVVLAAGGGRGVTAALCEELLARSRCRVVLAGRTDPGTVPASMLSMTDDQVSLAEAQFYRDEMARTPGVRPAQLRSRFQAIREAHEVATTVAQLRAAGHTVEYRHLDLSDADMTDALVGALVKEHGRLDLVVHGAASQVSRRTDLKSLDDFRRIVRVKVSGFENLRHAAARHGVRPAFHLLTSAFSFFGNDGQPDYGAANEALGRTAAADPDVTAIAWLGWAALGMTRGSEYESLARARGLRPLARDEGRRIYGALAAGPRVAGNNVLVTAGEQAFYGIPVLPPERYSASAEWQLSADHDVFLLDHRVDGTPTLPGTFEVEFAIRTAAGLCPGRTLVGIEETRFERFVKVPKAKQRTVRALARVVHHDDRETVAWFELRSDFTHASGAVLLRDVLNFSTYVRFAAAPDPMPAPELTYDGAGGEAVDDPYVDERSPVWLKGVFRCLHDIRLNGTERAGRFGPERKAQFAPFAGLTIPALLLDCLCRFAMIQRDVDGRVPLLVPDRCGRVRIRAGVHDALFEESPVVLRARMPVSDGKVARNARAEAVRADGEALLIVEDLTARQVPSIDGGPR